MRFSIFCLLTLFALNLNAQTSTTIGKFPCMGIVVQAPDSDDSAFVAAAVKQELIRAGKILVTDKGDILIVRLVVQHMKSSHGRNGKWGEVSLSVVSVNGHAAGTGRNYVGSAGGNAYYRTLKELAEITAKNFQYIE